jgi:hypothetical protein
MLQKMAMVVAVGAILSGALATAQPASAAQVSHDTNSSATTVAPRPTVQMFDCAGGTGAMGCGPGWFWRDGWRGFACYPC